MATTFTVGTNSRQYSTLQAAWNATAATWTDDYIFELYNDSEFTAGLTCSGKTTGSYSLTIRPATGQGFRDHASKTTNALRYNASNGVAASADVFSAGLIEVQQAVTLVLDGLQLKNTSTSGRVINISSGSAKVTAKNCILHTAGVYIVDAANASNGAFYNNVCVLTLNTASGLYINDLQPARGNTVVYIGSGSSSGTGIIANWGACTSAGNAVFGFTAAHGTANGGSYNSSSDYNATNLSSIGTSQGSNNVTSLTFANQFEAIGTAGAEDLRLKSGNGLAGEGVTNANIDPDILGQTRASPPAIGAVEPIAAAPAAPSGVTVGSVTGSSGSVSWTDNSSDETGFKVRYAPSPYSSWTTATGSVAASPYLVTGLTDNTSYKAAVAAFNGSGDSSWVESGVFTTTALSKLRPNADTSAGSWSASSGSVLYSMIDEAVADDADYISATTNTTCKIKIETSTDPADNSNHSLRIRARSTSGTLTVRLVQGDPAETTIVSWVPTLTSSFGNYQYDLSTAEASVITDYSALYLKFTSS